MFAKFVRQLEGNKILHPKHFGPAAPKQNMIFEAEEISYAKMCFLNFAAYIKWVEDSSDTPATTIGNFPENEEEMFEIVIARIYSKKENGVAVQETVHAPNCEFYLLNNDGKTIDRLWCANNIEQYKMLKEEQEKQLV